MFALAEELPEGHGMIPILWWPGHLLNVLMSALNRLLFGRGSLGVR